MKTLPDILEEFENEFTKTRHDGYKELTNRHAPDIKSFLSKVYAHAIENCLQEITEQKRLFANLPLGKRMNGWDALSDAEQSIKSLLDKEIKE